MKAHMNLQSKLDELISELEALTKTAHELRELIAQKDDDLVFPTIPTMDLGGGGGPVEPP